MSVSNMAHALQHHSNGPKHHEPDRNKNKILKYNISLS